MVTAVCSVVLAVLLLLPSPARGIATQIPGDSAGLDFLGFRPGARLDELGFRVRSASGTLRCRRSKADPRVSECRGNFRAAEIGPRVEIWVSAIDSVAGVMTLSGKVDSTQLDHWRGTLQSRYGSVPTKVQGTQRMLQWVRRGRMIRLTWRLEGNAKVASVSLVDGRVLDAWGRARAGGRSGPAHRDQPESRIR
jgi:hypothetical protein